MMKRRGPGAAFLLASFLAAAQTEPAILAVPGKPDSTITPASLLGAGQSEVRLEDMQGGVTVFHGRSLLEVLEKGGLDVHGMPNERTTAPAVVIAQGRDGYTAVFSIGELLMHRADPRVYLVAETAQGPLPADQGPIRLIVVGQRARSAYGLAKLEVRYLAENKPRRVS
jgi:hypothetical protein